MEVNESSMLNALKPLLEKDEKSLCPVYAMVNKQVKRMTHATSEYAYITITNKARLVLYRFDTSTSYSESYLLSTIIFGELHTGKNTGIYTAELSFLDEDPQPKGRAEDLPNQNKYCKKLYDILAKLIP